MRNNFQQEEQVFSFIITSETLGLKKNPYSSNAY